MPSMFALPGLWRICDIVTCRGVGLNLLVNPGKGWGIITSGQAGFINHLFVSFDPSLTEPGLLLWAESRLSSERAEPSVWDGRAGQGKGSAQILDSSWWLNTPVHPGSCSGRTTGLLGKHGSPSLPLNTKVTRFLLRTLFSSLAQSVAVVHWCGETGGPCWGSSFSVLETSFLSHVLRGVPPRPFLPAGPARPPLTGSLHSL